MKKISVTFLVILLTITYTYSQNHSKINSDTLHYFFTGHIKKVNPTKSKYKIDPRIEELDKTKYDRIWLGGDVCTETTQDYSTLQYLDSIFDLSKPGNYWALGNHDARNRNYNWISEFTHRKTYFAHYQDGITAIVLNTNLVPSDCENLNNQFNIIKNVCDTITKSSNLFMIMHHGIWRNVPNLPPPGTYAHSDLIYWNANCDSVNTSFAEVVYPLLKKVKKRGIEIYCILGDMGCNGKKFFMQSVDSINFMGCGLCNEPTDVVLIFNHILSEQKITWEFQNLDSLLNVQKQQKLLNN